MVIVAGILGVELPICPDALAVVAEHPHRPVEQAFELGDDRRAEIVRQRLGIGGERAEHRAVDGADAQRAQAVRAHVEAGVEPALAAHAAAERDRGQAAVEPVTPLMINADMLARSAAQFAPHQCAAMGAAVDEGLDQPVVVAIDDDRGLAEIGGAEIAGVGDFGLEREKAPGRPAEDRLLLAGVDFGVVIEAVRHPAIVMRRPDLVGDHHLPRPAANRMGAGNGSLSQGCRQSPRSPGRPR